MAALRMLAVAINSKRMGYVFLIGTQLKEWRTMTKPTKSPTEAAGALQDLINEFKPDVVVTEKLRPRANIASHSMKLKGALIRTAAQNHLLDVSVYRSHDYANKYEEAQSLAKFFPEIRPWVPNKRRLFDHEPARLTMFDALALAMKVLKRPTEQFAAAMG